MYSHTIIVLVDAYTIGYKFAGTYIAVCVAESKVAVTNNHLEVYHIYLQWLLQAHCICET